MILQFFSLRHKNADILLSIPPMTFGSAGLQVLYFGIAILQAASLMLCDFGIGIAGCVIDVVFWYSEIAGCLYIVVVRTPPP